MDFIFFFGAHLEKRRHKIEKMLPSDCIILYLLDKKDEYADVNNNIKSTKPIQSWINVIRLLYLLKFTQSKKKVFFPELKNLIFLVITIISFLFCISDEVFVSLHYLHF